jgi:hypothetical protein
MVTVIAKLLAGENHPPHERRAELQAAAEMLPRGTDRDFHVSIR